MRAAHSRTRSSVLVGIAVLIISMAGIATVLFRTTHSSDSTTGSASAPGIPTDHSASSAAKVTSVYYLAVKAEDSKRAYALLCKGRQTGYGAFAGEVNADVKTGTGIASFVLTATPSTSAAQDEADVPGRIKLTNGTETPINVLLIYSAGGWKVCSSDLGGILPGPGISGGVPTPTQTPVQTA